MGRLDFLQRLDDPDLIQEIREILAQMEVLSEAGIAPLGRSSRSSEKPLGPPGFGQPRHARSLWETYVERFERAVKEHRPRAELWKLVWQAEHDYKHRATPPTEEEYEGRIVGRPTRTSDSDLTRKVLREFEGEPSVKVAIVMEVPQGWVETVRARADRDPDYGFHRPDWRRMSTAEKITAVQQLKTVGLNQHDTARRLGCSVRTVDSYWRVAAA